MTNPSFENASCPMPLPHQEKIMLGHGSGGSMTHELFRALFLRYFNNPILSSANDSATIPCLEGCRIAISTDSHVVTPLFFPGGDIGRLAICGTVNDVAMSGASPKFITAGFILEEGLEIRILEKILHSMKLAAEEADVQIIAGDTKVVQKGKADGLYITTTGVGEIPKDINIGGEKAEKGDVIILSGSIGDHGIAVLEARGELGYSSEIVSDVAPLNHLVNAMLSASRNLHVLRDPTRGGLATTLVEIAGQSNVAIFIDEADIPVSPAVNAVCEILGFDPLYIANEGKLVAILPKNEAIPVLEAMKQTPWGSGAVVIGEVKQAPQGRVLLRTRMGTISLLDMLSGELLPRIC